MKAAEKVHYFLDLPSPTSHTIPIPFPQESLKIWEWYGKLTIRGYHTDITCQVSILMFNHFHQAEISKDHRAVGVGVCEVNVSAFNLSKILLFFFRNHQAHLNLRYTPWKIEMIKMEPKKHPFEKEKHLPNHHFQVLC